MKTVMRNRLPFAVLTLSFAFFLVATMYGGRLIYTMESNALKSQVTGSLSRDAGAVREFFSSCVKDLLFLKGIPGLNEYLTAGNASSAQRRRADDMLLMFAKSHPHYTSIRVIDLAGMERMSLGNTSASEPHIDLESLLKNRSDSNYYITALGLERDGIYASFFDTDKKEEGPYSTYTDPAITLASPVFDASGSKRGFIVLNVSIQELLGLLSERIFFQNDSGLLIISQRDGRVVKQQSPYTFKGDSGTITLSDTESVPYLLVDLVPGFRVWMARQLSSSAIKEPMIKLEIASVSILVTFFLTVLVLGFLNLRHFRSDNMAQKAIIHSLANLSEWRDARTGSHLERTRNFSVLLARTLRKKTKFAKVITDGFLDALYDAVPLHDIGKVAIRDDILLKSSRLSPEEFDVMKSHVVIGRDIIEDIIVRFRIDSRFLLVSRNICYCHHEKYDGSGYPRALRGDDIPVEARIFAICDVYDALRSERPYKHGLTHAEAVEIILPDRGRQFDPDVVDAFIECSDRFYEIFEVYKLFDTTYGRIMNVRSSDSLKIEWSDDLSVGDSLIDSQHMEFINRVNTLFTAVLMGEGKEETLRSIRFLHDYALHHFGTEEALMEKYGVPGYDPHKSEHVIFLRNLLAIKNAVKNDDDISSAVVVEINAKVVNWLITHIIEVDKKMKDHINTPIEIAAGSR